MEGMSYPELRRRARWVGISDTWGRLRGPCEGVGMEPFYTWGLDPYDALAFGGWGVSTGGPMGSIGADVATTYADMQAATCRASSASL